MGLVYTKGVVSSNGGKEFDVEFLVDSGATYSLIRKDIWKAMKLRPKREFEFRLADGTKIRRKVSECYIRFPFGDGHTPVILGESGDDINLLGAVTLEILGFVLDPLKREIRPAKMLLK